MNGSYNVTRNLRRNERDLVAKIEEYKKKGELPGFMKKRLEEAEELLSRVRGKRLETISEVASVPNTERRSAERVEAPVVPNVVKPVKIKKTKVIAERPKPTEKVLDEPFNKWIPWEKFPEASEIPFTTSVKGIGNGEHKLAAILGTTPNGQNKKYDLDLCLKVRDQDVCSKGEVKEIEKDSSFFPGANGRNEFRKTKHSLASLQEIFQTVFKEFKHKLSPSIIESMSSYKETADGKVVKNDLLTMTPDEISQKNLPKLIEACVFLHNLRMAEMKKTEDSGKTFTTYDILSGQQKQVGSTQLYKLCKAEDRVSELVQILGEEIYEREKFLDVTDHPIIQNPEEFEKYLGSFAAKLFQGYTLILVNKTKGFYIAKDLEKHVKIYRITKAYPKFLISFSGKWDDVQVDDEEQVEDLS